MKEMKLWVIGWKYIVRLPQPNQDSQNKLNKTSMQVWVCQDSRIGFSVTKLFENIV